MGKSGRSLCSKEMTMYESCDDDSEGDLVNVSVVPKPVFDTIVADPVTQNEPINNEDDVFSVDTEVQGVATDVQFGEPIKNEDDSSVATEVQC